MRELFFSESKINFLYCFENRQAIFNIHRMFKFILFGTQKGYTTEQFKCAFMKHDPERLPAIDSNALIMSVEHVKKFSPDSNSIMEFENQREIDIASTIFGGHSFLGAYLKRKWNTGFQREFNISDDSGLFISQKEI